MEEANGIEEALAEAVKMAEMAEAAKEAIESELRKFKYKDQKDVLDENGGPMRNNLRSKLQGYLVHLVCLCKNEEYRIQHVPFVRNLWKQILWIVICPSCRVESEVQEMSRMTVLITDGSGFLKANITTPEIEKFILFSATDMKIAAENGDNLCEAAIESVPITAFIRAYEVRVHRATETEMQVNIVKAYKPSDKPLMDTNPEIIDNISPVGPIVSPQKGNTSLTPISKSLSSVGKKETVCKVNDVEPVPVVQGSEATSPSVTHEVSQVIPTPSAPKKTTSSVPLHQCVPISVKSDVTPQLNDPRPSKKTK
ncbi:hypothetical protein LXL04_020026 [Taraxacum kok-saghyz]